MRRCASILTALMLALTFSQAPFRHFHEHEENNRQPHDGFFHVHFQHPHPPGVGPEIRESCPDDDAVYQNWYVSVLQDLAAPVSMPAGVYELAPIETSEPYTGHAISGGHDPPAGARTAPRAPPI